MEQRLADFLAAIETTGNMTKAAQSLFITQPYISQTISRAEHDLQVALLNRQHQPLTLTYAGKRVLTYLQAEHQLQRSLKQELHQLTNHAYGSLSLAINQPLAATWLPAILPTLYTKFPQLHTSLMEMTTSDAEQLLPAGKIDAFIGKAIHDDRLSFHTIGRVTLALVVPSSYSIHVDPANPLAVLTNQNFIRLSDPSRFQEMVDHFFQDNGITVINRIEAPDSRVALQLSLAQLGCTITGLIDARQLQRQQPQRLQVFPIPIEQLSLDMGISYPRQNRSEVMTTLVNTVTTVLPALI
ncbi:LysR substrate-binding domain-containing protein [Lactiplantibacillus dongliensis]|uniref:LysR substrate-binding domain-containing protein n=1 Tax=Lactiplantibacillus dongliensis TaxID=2559919 RepID=A0ABW1R620_9LACO|nr:LysR family transcriptional regulator [Lactiplantibacillus dongliensis]